mgnify:CR=1 FL=1
MRFSFILLAGGISERFKSNVPKQYHKIGGKTLIDIAIQKISQFNEIKKIIVIYNKKHKKYLKNLKLKNVKILIGGTTRSKSTLIGLNYLVQQKKTNKVLIHDAARPNFSKNLIKKIIKNSTKNNAIIPILKIEDALKEIKNKNSILSKKRNNFFLTQTPQCFTLNEIFQLHNNKKQKYQDDDFSLIDNVKKVKLISGEKKNFKITDLADLNLLKKINKTNIKIGIGFDVHRLVVGRKLYLGGIKIPSPLGTLGHSDGDPVLHSVIDALLGACGLGDIGEKFSNKSKKNKNISSTKLIKEVIKEVKQKNYTINNIDINIITETPKLKKFKEKIAHNIAILCHIPRVNINIKAKTTEKLGVIGERKAIASEVIMTVFKND